MKTYVLIAAVVVVPAIAALYAAGVIYDLPSFIVGGVALLFGAVVGPIVLGCLLVMLVCASRRLSN